jgi:hypothetical protein
VAKELTDNALDAGNSFEIGFSPNGGFFVADSGKGIPGDNDAIARLFSIRRPLTSSKLIRLPTRGALGNGLRVVVGAVFASQGSLTVKTHGRSLSLTPQADGTTKVLSVEPWDGEGTCIEVKLGPALQVDADDLFDWPEVARELSSQGENYKGKSSPWWYDPDSFWMLLQAHQGRTVRSVVQQLEGCGREKATEIAGDFLNRKTETLSHEEAAKLLSLAKDAT